MSEIALQLHPRKFFPVSARDAALDQEIQDVDKLWVAAVCSGADQRFLDRLLARRNDLSREQAHEWRMASLIKVPA